MNTEPRVYARYEFGVEKVADLKGKARCSYAGRRQVLIRDRRTGRQGNRSKSHGSGTRWAIVGAIPMELEFRWSRKLYILYKYAERGIDDRYPAAIKPETTADYYAGASPNRN